MPFNKRARIEIENQGEHAYLQVSAERLSAFVRGGRG
jgi:hypothetical protein